MVERAGSGQGKKGTGKGKINELVEQPKEGENPLEVDGNGSSSTDHQPRSLALASGTNRRF